MEKLSRTYGADPLEAWLASERRKEENNGFTPHRLRQHAQAIDAAESLYVRRTPCSRTYSVLARLCSKC